MKVIVTGANGMLGQDLCPILRNLGHEVYATDIDSLDITNLSEVEHYFLDVKPDTVIHCAAYTNVDKAETDIENAKRVNGLGTDNVAIASNKVGATLVYVSTDYVFKGDGTRPYLPSDPVNPLNVYGETKLQGELAVKKYCKKFYIARTSWLYGLHGKNFVETMINLSNLEELKVVDDQVGCPTWTVELCNGILNLLDNMPYGIYHVCGSGSTSWYGFAKTIFEKLNLKVNLKPCTTAEFPRPAKRPKFSIMNNDGLCRDWKLALDDYLSLRCKENK